MAHYDCSYCGAYGGINYGICTNCTPKPLLEAKEKLKQARADAEAEWLDFTRALREQFLVSKIRKDIEHLEAMEKLYPRL